MDSLCLPQYEIKVKKENGRMSVLDVLRRKYVVITPEEWVRQHFVHFLMEHLGYPPALLQNEVELRCGDKKLRCDSILYGTDARPRMIIEYKAPHIAITQKVFDQISAYNLLLHVDYLIVSNGKKHYCCKMDYVNNSYHFLREIPPYCQL
ncbi:type I restriction enzyme HsdR N-terminal domain-containing protein [Prevotella sp. PINT]|jgi:hypothetical protein|uniref:type I restriction enzyme HsdR N-terminal domain-containing protein n=1 Tax=Palleniella intestinalis TaxID=2736291 RepID=UPI001551D454|nr:type I restriction enzyme HsdR N-terminal domain-containing protein [Palleniella intestinalis]NPD81253.1 type I restriction enzyme HsdR N-terminal domain-containing protein [Palleniella intestinalis]